MCKNEKCVKKFDEINLMSEEQRDGEKVEEWIGRKRSQEVVR